MKGTVENQRSEQLSVQHKVEAREEEAWAEASRGCSASTGLSLSESRNPQCASVFGRAVPAPRSRSSVRVCAAERRNS